MKLLGTWLDYQSAFLVYIDKLNAILIFKWCIFFFLIEGMGIQGPISLLKRTGPELFFFCFQFLNPAKIFFVDYLPISLLLVCCR